MLYTTLSCYTNGYYMQLKPRCVLASADCTEDPWEIEALEHAYHHDTDLRISLWCPHRDNTDR